MSLTLVIFLICLTFGVSYIVYVKRKERELIEQVTSITRGEWSERKVVLKLLKAGVNPKAIFHDLYIRKSNGEYTQVDVADNTFIIYPHSIQRMVSEILMQPNANFGNKYEIMNLFTKAVQNGNDPMIVASQINSAFHLKTAFFVY